AVLLTQIVSLAVGYRNEKQLLIDNTLKMNRMSAERLAITTDHILKSLTNALATAAAHFSAETDRLELRDHLELIRQSNNSFNSLFISDDHGNVLAASPAIIELEEKQLTSLEARQALKEKRPLISEPYVGVTDRLIILGLAERLENPVTTRV